MVGFARALITARRVESLATLSHAHGISDTSSANSRIAELTVRIDEAGTFQEFNDVVAELNRFCYFDESTAPRALYLPSAKSDQLAGLRLSLKEILSRIPQLEDLFHNTFHEDPNVNAIYLHNLRESNGYWQLVVFDPQRFPDVASLRQIVERWRERHPFLKDWCLVSAARAYGKSQICFGNVSNAGIDEFGEAYLDGDGDWYEAKVDPLRNTALERFPIEKRLPPPAGGYPGGGNWAITHVNGVYFSEFALHYLAMFLLSSLVRYRPQTWEHAVSRTGLPDAPTDDQPLALIERFLEINSTAIPSLVVTALNPHEDQYA